MNTSSCVPAHKQTDPAKKPGQICNDVTLNDYIERQKATYAPKMSFDEWYSQSGWAARFAAQSLDDADSSKFLLSIGWQAAQENM